MSETGRNAGIDWGGQRRGAIIWRIRTQLVLVGFRKKNILAIIPETTLPVFYFELGHDKWINVHLTILYILFHQLIISLLRLLQRPFNLFIVIIDSFHILILLSVLKVLSTLLVKHGPRYLPSFFFNDGIDMIASLITSAISKFFHKWCQNAASDWRMSNS